MCLELQNKKLLSPLTVFHTWRCKFEGVGRDSGCGHEESHTMHDTKHSIYVTPPTRHPMWVSGQGVTLRDCHSLTFSFSELTPAFICTIYVITKIIYIHKRTTTGVVSIDNKNSFTYTLYSIHLSLSPFYFYYYNCTIKKLYI